MLLTAALLAGCGDKPTEPDIWTGSIEVRGQLGAGGPADSLHIILDDDTLGYRPYAYVIDEVVAGKHRLLVHTVTCLQQDTLVWFSPPQDVWVEPLQKRLAEFTLQTNLPASPYPGFPAPDFTLADLDSNELTLDSFSGEVTLLYFFSLG
ncbi:MAG: hypothetical protein C4524_14750 [Candidatus Zixiibacteriota bacterium]|nr:MAG: hypothetical protein C4524_14750 [candidate division Zixibacteria bacterium]